MSSSATAVEQIPKTEERTHPVVLDAGFFSATQRKALGQSVWIYGWLLSRATPSQPPTSAPEGTDASQWAPVRDGRPIPHKKMARDLASSVSAIKSHLKKLAHAHLAEVVPCSSGVRVRIKLPPGWVWFDSRPSQPDPQLESGPLPSVSRAGIRLSDPKPSDPKPSNPADSEADKTDRFRVLLNAYKRVCAERGVRPLLDWDSRQSLLWFLRGHPNLSSDELTSALHQFAASSGDLSLSEFVRVSEKELRP